MNKHSKFLKISMTVLISVICLAIVVSIIYIKVLFPSPISKSNMENEFLKNKDIIISVAKFLEKQEYSKIYITSTDDEGEMYASNANEVFKPINISNALIADNMTTLFKKYKYKVITKKNNGIYFQRWSNRDFGRGIVYSINGEDPQNEFITKLEPLSEINWYYYEEK